LESAEAEPTVLVNRGQPRVVLMSAEKYRRLKIAAGEPVPAAALLRRPLVLRGRADDPLGYDPSDFREMAHRMAHDVLSGRTAEAVEVERARIRIRLGLDKDVAEVSGPRP
jgi:hypothetical protein